MTLTLEPWHGTIAFAVLATLAVVVWAVCLAHECSARTCWCGFAVFIACFIAAGLCDRPRRLQQQQATEQLGAEDYRKGFRIDEYYGPEGDQMTWRRGYINEKRKAVSP